MLPLLTALSALHSKTVFSMKLKRRKNLQSSRSRLTLKPDIILPNCIWRQYSILKQYFILFSFVMWHCFSRCTVLVELEVHKKEALNYAPGDHVGIFPGNSPELVMGILKHLRNAPPTNQSVQLEYLPESCYGNRPYIFKLNAKLLPIGKFPCTTCSALSCRECNVASRFTYPSMPSGQGSYIPLGYHHPTFPKLLAQALTHD